MNSRLTLRSGLALIVAPALAGCTLGPDFVQPAPPTIAHYSTTADPAATTIVDGEVQQFHSGADVAPEWWRLFKNPDLDSLVATGLKNNQSLAAALATFKQSEADLNAGKGVFFPEVDLGAGFARQRLSPVRQGIAGPATVFNLYTLSTAVSYTLDFFGAERRTVEGLSAQADGQRATVRAAYLSLIGNIINTAIAEAAYRAQAEATERLIDMQRQQLAVVKTQAEAGLVPTSTIVAVTSLLVGNEAILPTLRQRQAAAQTLLATLLGHYPADTKAPQLDLDAISLPIDLPVTLPSDLVRHRPDIRLAEANLHVASAQVGVATAALFPTFTLTGDYGRNNPQWSQLGNSSNSSFWGFGPNIAFPLFQGGSAWYHKKASEAAYDAALANYRQAVLTGIEQVADILQAVVHDAEIAAASRQALDLANQERDLVEANHTAGLVNDLDWLIARQQVETAEITVINAIAQRYQDTVALYVALGGGWWRAPSPEDSLTNLSCDGRQGISAWPIPHFLALDDHLGPCEDRKQASSLATVPHKDPQ
jgi:NodT family efflux transporter outer membrane factor (OMF) lipoprotein